LLVFFPKNKIHSFKKNKIHREMSWSKVVDGALDAEVTRRVRQGVEKERDILLAEAMQEKAQLEQEIAVLKQVRAQLEADQQKDFKNTPLWNCTIWNDQGTNRFEVCQAPNQQLVEDYYHVQQDESVTVRPAKIILISLADVQKPNDFHRHWCRESNCKYRSLPAPNKTAATTVTAAMAAKAAIAAKAL
jgi:hypothetical protein